MSWRFQMTAKWSYRIDIDIERNRQADHHNALWSWIMHEKQGLTFWSASRWFAQRNGSHGATQQLWKWENVWITENEKSGETDLHVWEWASHTPNITMDEKLLLIGHLFVFWKEKEKKMNNVNSTRLLQETRELANVLWRHPIWRRFSYKYEKTLFCDPFVQSLIRNSLPSLRYESMANYFQNICAKN